MFGEIKLGCLLGQYDLAQSFDISSVSLLALGVNSWDKISDQSSVKFVTEVHSSLQGLEIRGNSDNTKVDIIRYNYGYADDIFARWFPDVETHDIYVSAWARSATEVTSGNIEMVLTDSGRSVSRPVRASQVGLLQGTLNMTGVHSLGLFPRVSFGMETQPGSISLIRVDDVLTEVDRITFDTDWERTNKEALIKASHSTLGGKYRDFKWGSYWQYELPLRFVSTSHSNLLNWWWEKGLNLVLTLNTSDSQTQRICRISGPRRPMEFRHQPYDEKWRGFLRLESIDDGSLRF